MSAKTPPAPPAPTDVAPEAAEVSPTSNRWSPPRRTKTPREPSGRVLPPAPAWMQKPLKPPAFARRNAVEPTPTKE